MLFGKNFDDLDAATCQSLIDFDVPESVHLEFKRESYGGTEKDKKEFLKDITAFANTLGGHLVIGLNEKDGIAESFMPFSQDVDGELLRLESIARTGIQPALVGLRMKPIEVDGGFLIVIQVPRSFNPPHRVIFKNSNRFWGRNSSGAYELSIEELRMLFGEQRSIEERAKAFVGERFLRIQAGDGVMPFSMSAGVLVMHLVPLPDFGAHRQIEIPALKAKQHQLSPISAGGYSGRINLDGYYVYSGDPDCDAYTQIFRNGSVEATNASLLREKDGKLNLPKGVLPQKLISALQNYMSALQDLEASPPIFLQISAMNINGMRMPVNYNVVPYEPPPYEREVMHLPPKIITEYGTSDSYQSIIAEQMHFLWNAYDFVRCEYFNEEDQLIEQ